MANGGNIDFGIRFKADKTGLNEIKRDLAQLKQLTPTDLLNMNSSITSMQQARSEIGKLQYDINQIETAFSSAFDTTTGVTNIERLNKNLKTLDLARISQSFSQVGIQGQQAFTKIATQAMTTNMRFKETNNILTKIGTTLGNTIKWNISSKIINTFTGSIQQAWGYVQHLDTSLNDIRIVTGKSAEEMDKFAVKANAAAKALGNSTTEYTEAALIYYQQGLSDEESSARAETTIKAANVTGQTGEQVSEELTAVWNGYKVTAEETELYVDKLAAVAATTAADLEELSTGMSKVASAAANMGVDIDQLNAQLATIVSVTRQAPESVGTALKTIYARIEDLKLGGEDEDGTKLGQVSSGLESMGIEIKDAQGDLRDLGEVIEEIGGKWDSWTESQQAAIAQLVAGKRQYNNLIALFDNWGMYTDALNTSKNAMGTLQQQQDIYMESTAAHLQQLKTQWEDLYDSMINTSDINNVLDISTNILDKITLFTDAIGGGKGALLGLSAILTKVLNQQISQNLEGLITKFTNVKYNIAQVNAELSTTKMFAQNMGLNPKLTNEIVALKSSVKQYYDVMSQEEIQQNNVWIKQASDIGLVKEQLEEALKTAKQFTAEMAASQVKTKSTKDSYKNKIQNTNTPSQDLELNNKGKTVGTAYDQLYQDLDKVGKKYSEIQTKVQSFEESVKNLAQEQSKGPVSVNEIEAVNKAYKDVEDTVKQYGEELKKLGAYADATGNKKMQQEYAELEKRFNSLTTAVKDYKDNYAKASQYEKANKTKDVNNNLRQQEQALNELVVAVETYAKEQQKAFSPEIVEKIEAATKAYNDNKTVINAMKQALDTRQLVSGITSIVSGLSTLGMAYTTVTSLGKTWADETTSLGDKVAQTFISLGMLMPAITTAMTGITNAMTIYNVLAGSQILINGGLYTSEKALAAARALNNETLGAALVELAGQGVELDIVAVQTAITTGNIDKETLSLILNTSAVEGDAVAHGVLGDAMKDVNSGTQGIIKFLPKVTNLLNTDVAALKTMEVTVGGLTTTLGTLAIAFAAVTVAIAAGVFVYKTYQDHVQAAAEAAQNAATQAKKTTEELSKQKDVINEVAQAYKELKEQYDETQTDELRQATYELCKQHGLQDLAVKALIADYEELDDIITKAQNSINEDTKKATEDEMQKIENSVMASVNKNKTNSSIEGSNVDTNKHYMSLKGSGGINSESEEQLFQGLEQLGIKRVAVDGYYGEYIAKEDFVKASLEHYDELLELLSNSNTKAAKDLQKILDEQSENLSRYAELKQQNTTQIAETYLPTVQQVSSVKDLKAVKNQLLQDSDLQQQFLNTEGEVDTEAMEKWVDEWLQSIDEVKQYIENADISGLVAKKLGATTTSDPKALATSTIDAQVEALDDTTKNFLQENIDLLPLFKDVDEFVAYFQSSIDALKKQEVNVKVNAVFDSEKNGEFDEEAIADLFENSDFEEYSGISQEAFSGMDFEEQRDALLDYYMTANNAEDSYQQKVQSDLDSVRTKIANASAELQQLTQDKDKYGGKGYSVEDLDAVSGENNYLDSTIQKLAEAANNTDLLKEKKIKLKDSDRELYDSTEEITEALKEYNGENNETLTSLGKALNLNEDQLKNLSRLLDVQEDFKKTTEDYNKEGKKYSDLVDDIGEQTKDLNEIEEKATDTTQDWASAHKEAQDALDDISSQIDDIQSAYSSLTSIMEDYNETGSLSMDNLQSLLAMDDEYLAALSFENGQMTLNEEALKQMTLARLDEAQAKVLDETETELLALAEQQAQNASSGVETQTDNTKTAVEECTAALKEGTAAWNDYWNAMKQSTGATGAQADTIIEAGKTRYEAINKVKDQILSGDFSTTMNGSSSSSSSSGSSSSSESEPDEKDELKITDIDLYRGINEELEKMESILGRIQEIDEHSWGASAIKALEAEGELLEDQIEKYEEKRELQEGDLSKKKGELEAEGIQFSEDGSTMTNASEKLKSLYEEYNSMVASYNAMSKTEQDEYEKTLEKKKEAIDDLEDAIDDYESLYSDWQDTLDTLLDKQYELIENAVNQFNATVDLHLELDDAEKDWNDFWYDVVKDIDDSGVEDKIESLAEKISKSLSNLTTLVGYGANAAESSVGELTDHLNKTIDEVKKQIATASTGGSGSIFGIDTEKSKETLTDYRDRLIEAVTEAKEAVDDIADTYLDMLDAAQDKIDKQVEGWESINDHLEHNVKLIKLISGEDSYDALNKQYERQYENDKNLLNTAKQSQEFWKEQISHYQELMNNTEKGSKQWKTYSKALETATDNYRDSVNKLDKALEDALSNLDEWRKNQEDAALKTLDRAMSGGLGLDLVEQQWKLIDDHSSKYLDNVEKAISLEQYTNELEKAANEVGLSAENQAKLNKFRDEELSKLNTKAKLTKYDIEESRARLEIMRQEMLLEEQKNNKSNMRLRRDSQGNYSYQYTGNEEEEEEAEEGLLTAKQAWYDLVKSRYKETREWILELEKEQSSLLAQIRDAEAAGDVERLNYLKEMYETNAKDISDAYAEAEKNKRDLFDGTAQYFADVENAQILPQSEATVSALIDQWAAGGEQSFIGAVEKAVTDLDEIQQEYLTKQNDLLQEAGVNYEDLKNDGIDPTTDSLGDLVDTNEELAEQLEQVNDQLTQQEENLRAAEEAYNSLKDAAVTAIQEANEWLKTLAETAVETVSTVQKAIESAESSASSYANSAGSKTSSGGSSGGSNSGSSSGASYILGPSKSGAHNTFGVYRKGDDTSNPDNAIDSGTPSELKKRYQSGEVQGLYKSGGYTGDWIKGIPGTDNGRLAVLHPKELVLNESDTSNILKAVDTIRDLVSSSSSLDLDGIARSIIQIGSSQVQMLAQVGSGIMSAMSSVVSNSQSYNSNMTVNADFSGVRSAEAIYQALRELENYGSQQAYSNAPHMNKAY